MGQFENDQLNYFNIRISLKKQVIVFNHFQIDLIFKIHALPIYKHSTLPHFQISSFPNSFHFQIFKFIPFSN